jgi:hypothetical protein
MSTFLTSAPTCPPGRHAWRPTQVEGTLRCASCGIMARCCRCAEGHGEAVMGWPEITCFVHGDEERGLVWRYTFPSLLHRCLFLGQGMPPEWWRVEGEWEDLAVRQPAYTLTLRHQTKRNAWIIQVTMPGRSSPVFYAQGPYPNCQVAFFQPGPWVRPLLATETLRDGVRL